MKKQKRALGLLLSVLTFGTVVLPGFPADKAVQSAGAEEMETSYIITLKCEDAVEAVCNKYGDILDTCMEENPDELTEEGILVSDMTASEVEMLENDRNILSVEKNFVLEGNGRKGDTRTGKNGRRCRGGYGRKSTGPADMRQDGTGKGQDKEKQGGLHIEYVDAGQDDNWNLETIHAAGADDGTVEDKQRVRVAILDSGVDLLDNIEVKERKNFIPGQEGFTVMFEDEAGHGTAVAGIIAGEAMDGETAEGVNRNVELYSAKVLDENSQAPLGRIIEGIYWAIGKNVHIINMSFGTDRYSQALEEAVKAAADKGILMVAAAGNQGNQGIDTVEYPAAFPEVVAVGSVDARGEVSDFSAKGEEVELVAPGEAVRVTGAFGADMAASGTSMAAPHVTAAASLLWGKDLSKPAAFIRTLLDESARNLGSGTECGYGLVDYEYAEQMYDAAERQLEENQEVNVPENEAKVQVFDNSRDVERLEEKEQEIKGEGVKGSWKWEVHREYINAHNVNLPAMKAGAVYPDRAESGVNDMKIYPDFHGYYQTTDEKDVNYMASYHFMIKIAQAYGKGKNYTDAVRSKGLTDASYKAIRKGFKGMNKKIKSYSKNNDRKAFVYGIAMHTATDVFAHSTMQKWKGKWQRIEHGAISEGYGADKTEVQPRRHVMAVRVERNVVYRFQGKRKDVPVVHDFHAHGDTKGDFYVQDADEKLYRVFRIQRYAKSAGVTNTTALKHFGYLHRENDDKK